MFNIGADRPYEVVELAHLVSHALGVEPDIVYLPPRQEVMHAYASHEKVQKVFGDRQPIPLEVGIGHMARWAQEVGPRATSEFEGVEVWKNFPAGWGRLGQEVNADSRSLTVSIVNTRQWDWLEPCLRSVLDHPYKSGPFDIIVLDNASADGSVEKIGAAFPEVRLIAENIRRGVRRQPWPGCRSGG